MSTSSSADLALAAQSRQPGRHRLLTADSPGVRAFGDTYDLGVLWFCNSDSDYLPEVDSAGVPCLGLIYDGLSEICGHNPFSGASVEISETETVNGDGTVTITIQAASGDGTDMMPNGTECAPGDVIDVLGADLAKQDAGGPGVPGDPLDPDLGVSPFDIVEAEAVIFGAGGSVLLTFDLNSAGTTATNLKDRFTLGGVSGVTVTALQFRYRIEVGEFTGACCLPDDSCTNGLTGVECATLGGTYQGDFSTCPGPFCGVPVSDTCDQATAVSDGVTAYDTAGATLDASAPAPCDAGFVNDVWFRHTSICTGELTVETCDSGAGPDTVLEVYLGSDCGTMTSQACADDSGCGADGSASSATVSATVGAEHTIRLAGAGGADVAGNLNIFCSATPAVGACCLPDDSCTNGLTGVECATLGGTYQGDFSTCPGPVCGVPVNDTCEQATAVTDGLTPYDTAGATLDSGAPAPCDPDFGNDIWFAHTASCTGDLTVETCDSGAGPDTVLEVYSGSDCGAMTSHACADDSGCGAGGAASSVTVSTTAGAGYLIRLGGAGGADVAGNLSVVCSDTPPAGGACCLGDFSCADVSSEAACTGAGGTYLGDGTSCGLFFSAEALSSAAVFDTCNSDYNTVLRVFDACGGTLLGENDDCADTLSGAGADPDASCYDADTSSTERDSCLCISTTAGVSYYVQVTSFGGGPPPPGSSTSVFVLHTPECTLPPIGACSLTDSTCVEGVTQAACEDNGGTYRGDDTTCVQDCNSNGIPDDVDIAEGTSQDCNTNDVPDECDLADGTSTDLNTNGIPDDCEPDCNDNNVPDDLDIADGFSEDCNSNGIPDECDIADGTSTDLNNNGVPDECDDCNSNGLPDDVDIATGESTDINSNWIPDECEPLNEDDDPLLEPGPKDSPPADPCDCVVCEDPHGSLRLDPVHLFSGEFYESAEDLRISGRGLDFVWGRKYRSRIGPDTPAGQGWDFSYNVFLERADAHLKLHDGNTRVDTYAAQPGGTWADREFFREISQNPDNSFTLTFQDTGSWQFHALDGSPTEGKLSAISDRNGNTIALEYDSQGRLVTIHDTLDTEVHNRDVTIAYNDDGLVESVTDYAGRQVTYEYYDGIEPGGSLGDLKSVTTPVVVGTPNGNDYPAGKTTIYTYTTGFSDERLNHDLLTITDPKGQTYLVNTYAHTVDEADPRHTTDPANPNFDRLVRQVWGEPGDMIDLVYVPQTPDESNNFAVIKVIANDRVGNVKEFFYDDRNRGVIQRDYTGRAPDPDAATTETLNRPTGQLRPGDPAFFETRVEYNEDSLVTRISHPNGNVTENVYEMDLDADAPRRSRGNLREVHRLPGPLGGDQDEIVELFEYDVDLGGCCGTNFVTRHVDGRGNETVHGYDDAGNRTQTVHRIAGIVEDWEYNDFGQMTAHVLPDNGSGHRRRDEFTYYASGPQAGYRRQQIVDAAGFALTTTFEYDDRGNLIRRIDPRGHDALYTFNALDQVVRETSRQVTDGSGVRYETDTFYDANDNIVRIDTQNIDDQGVLQANAHFSVVYDREILNRQARICEEVGSADLEPGDLDCSTLPAGEFVVTEYEYDANRNHTLLRKGEATNGNQPANVVRTLYDERDLVFQEIRATGDPDQVTTRFDYDGNRNRTMVSQGLEDSPRAIAYAYDGYDRLVSTTGPMGNVATVHYDANGNRVSERIDGEVLDVPGQAGNVRLSEVTVTYDAMDRLTHLEAALFDTQTQTSIGDGLATTDVEYSDNSQVTRMVDDNLHQALTAYDTANRRSVMTDHKGNTGTHEYDQNSNLLSVTQVEKSDLGEPDEIFVTSYAYDNLDRRIRMVDDDANTVEYGYDSRDNRTVLIDALRPVNPIDPGNIVRYAYDGLNRLTTTTRFLTDDGTGTGNPAGTVVTTQTWDDSSRLVAETDDNGNTTSYVYDALNRLVTEDCADGTQNTFVHDVHDNVVIAADANGSVATTTFDLLNRVASRVVVPGPGVTDDTTVETFTFDGRSRMVRAEDDDSIVTRDYDSLSRTVAESLNGQVTTSVFDGVGNQLTCVYPSGRTITRSYDELNRLQSILDGGGLIAEYDYVGPARTERRTFGNNTQTDFTYDNVRRIVGMRHAFDPEGADNVIDQRTYAWDRMYNKVQRADVRPGGPRQVHDYTYDSIYRLAHTTVNDPARSVVRDTAFFLDNVGNRIFVGGNPGLGVGYYTRVAGPPLFDGEANQYTTTPDDVRSYDRNGNLTTVGAGDVYCIGHTDLDEFAVLADCLNGPDDPTAGSPWCQAFDLEGEDHDVDLRDYASFQRLFGTTISDGCAALISYDYRDRMVEYVDMAAGQRHTYAYDALGRRIARVVDADDTAAQTQYFYDGWRVCEEQDGEGQPLATYVYGRYIDEVLNMQRDVDASGSPEDYYYHCDDLHNVVAVTDAAGAVSERYDYLDFGGPLFFDSAGIELEGSQIGNPYLFTGRRYDPESRWYFYRSRYLDPVSGRFTSQDALGPWGDDAGLGNAFTYVGNGPFTAVDPHGLKRWRLQKQTTQGVADEWGGGEAGGGAPEWTRTGDVWARDSSLMFGFWKIEPTDDGGSAEAVNTYWHEFNNFRSRTVHNVFLKWLRRYRCNPRDGTLMLLRGPAPSGKSTDGKAYASIWVNVWAYAGYRNRNFEVYIETGAMTLEPTLKYVTEKFQRKRMRLPSDDLRPYTGPKTENWEQMGMYFTAGDERGGYIKPGSLKWTIRCVCDKKKR